MKDSTEQLSRIGGGRVRGRGQRAFRIAAALRSTAADLALKLSKLLLVSMPFVFLHRWLALVG